MAGALLIVNMGGPANTNQVRPYLKTIFRDPRILSVPALLRPVLSALIVTLRADKVIERYNLIGGGSPLLKWTKALLKNMEQHNNSSGGSYARITHAFRYSTPDIRESMTGLSEEGFRDITLMPLFPHYTDPMTGSVFAEAEKVSTELNLKLTKISVWGQRSDVIKLQTGYLNKAIYDVGKEARVLFVAHGVPVSLIKKGDTYDKQVEASARSLAEKLPEGTKWSLAYQSKVGPATWTEPYLEDELKRLLKSNKPLVVMPLSFVADCLETLYDLDIVVAKEVAKAGVEKFIRVSVFNDDPEFAKVLLEIAEEAWQ